MFVTPFWTYYFGQQDRDKNSLGAMFFVMISSDQFRSFKGGLRNMFSDFGTFVLHAEDFQKALREELCTDLYENEAEQDT